MTQISRKFFNKSPFARSDTGSVPRAGGLKARPHVQVVLCPVRSRICACFRWSFESRADRSRTASAGIAAVLPRRSWSRC